MGLLKGMKNRLGGGNRYITLHDWQKSRHSRPTFSKEEVRACTTDPPRFVIAEQSEKKHVLYTESLITCIGVLIHGRGSRGDVAGLVHALAGKESEETRRVLKVIEKINSENHKPQLAVTLVIGDEPDPDLFRNIAANIIEFDNISKNHVKLIYAGEGEPGFENGFTDPIEYSAKVAYDTKKHQIYIGADKKKK